MLVHSSHSHFSCIECTCRLSRVAPPRASRYLGARIPAIGTPCDMAPKKHHLHGAPQPSPKKARVATGTAELSAGHPTLQFMSKVMLNLQSDLDALKTATPEPFGGTAAFDPDQYKEAMSKNNEYEATTLLCHHKIMTLEHSSVWPCMGSVHRLEKMFFTTDDGEPTSGGSSFPTPIPVRATSADAAPHEYERLHMSAYLFAFMAAWSKAKSKKMPTDDFVSMAKRIKTRFFLLPSDDDAERKKWQLQEGSDAITDNTATLIGYKRTIGVAEVQMSLRDRGHDHDAAAIAEWFKKIRFNESSDQITQKEASRYLRVHAKLTANPLLFERLDLLESHFGRRHGLVSVTTLDAIGSKTNLNQNATLSTELLTWVIDGITIHMLRGTIKPDTPRDALVQKWTSKMMLIRRVIQFLTTRFKWKPDANVVYVPGFDPATVAETMFGSWGNFHRLHPLGKSLDEAVTETTTTSSNQVIAIGKLSKTHQTILEFCRCLMNCESDLDSIVTQAVAQEAMVSAESFFERRTDLRGLKIFDLAAVSEAHKAETKPPAPVPMLAAAETNNGDDTTAEIEQVPDATDDATGDDKTNSETYFPMLHLEETARSRFDSVNPKRFADIVAHAETRISSFVDLKVMPGDPAAISEYVSASPCVQQMQPGDKAIFLWTAQTSTESIHHSRLFRPYKYLANLEKTSLDQIIPALHEDKTFQKHPSAVLVSDGRRASSGRAIGTALNKLVKASKGTCRNPVAFRLMHSNAEFTSAGRGDGTSLVCPEPLETIHIACTKNYKVPVTPRKFLDLPGSNRCKGLNNVPLKAKTGIMTSWAHRCDILAGCSRLSPEDDADGDWIDEAEGGDAVPCDVNEDFSKKGCDLFPWEHHESVAREFINCFDPATVIHYNAGSGSWALGAARHARAYVGFCRNSLHLQYLLKSLIAHVCADIIEGKQDGFYIARLLCAQRSLGGSTEEPGPPERNVHTPSIATDDGAPLVEGKDQERSPTSGEDTDIE